jgi:hypothetical protein
VVGDRNHQVVNQLLHQVVAEDQVIVVTTVVTKGNSPVAQNSKVLVFHHSSYHQGSPDLFAATVATELLAITSNLNSNLSLEVMLGLQLGFERLSAAKFLGLGLKGLIQV